MATASPNPNFHKNLFRTTPLSDLPTMPPPLPIYPKTQKARVGWREQGERGVCEWCQTNVTYEAVCCPHCGKWRKDIMKLRFMMRKQLISMIVCAVAIAVLFLYSWPKEGQQWDKCPWHEIVTFPGSARLGWNEQPKGGFPSDFFPRSELRFSMQKFLKGPAGWIIIVSFVHFFISAFCYRYNQSILRRKRGNY